MQFTSYPHNMGRALKCSLVPPANSALKKSSFCLKSGWATLAKLNHVQPLQRGLATVQCSCRPPPQSKVAALHKWIELISDPDADIARELGNNFIRFVFPCLGCWQPLNNQVIGQLTAFENKKTWKLMPCCFHTAVCAAGSLECFD